MDLFIFFKCTCTWKCCVTSCLRSAGQKVSRSNTCWREFLRNFFWNFRIDKLRKLSTLLSDLLTQQQQQKFPTLSCIQTSSKLRKFFATTIKSPFTTVVSLPSLAWQLLSIVLALIKVPEFSGRVVISKCEIVGNVVRDRDLVAKRKITNYLAWRVCWWFVSLVPRFISSSARGKEPGYDEASDSRENLCSQNFPLYTVYYTISINFNFII